MTTVCPLGYHHNGFVTTHALEHMAYIGTCVHLYWHLRTLIWILVHMAYIYLFAKDL